MRSSSVLALAVSAIAATGASARAQTAPPAAPGFAVERLDLAPAGAGWIALDDLAMQPGLGGALALEFGYEHAPLRIDDGGTRVPIVSQRSTVTLSGSVTYDRFRFSLAVESELWASGDSPIIDGYQYTAPSIDPSSHPDAIADPRLGVDVRLVGDPASVFRLGVSGELFALNGTQADYDSDGTWRGIVRAEVAGDTGAYSYAAYAGVHIRTLDDASIPGSPRGSEFVFGAGGGVATRVGNWRAVIGPEVFGATAFEAAFGDNTTALEALASGRIEQVTGKGRQIRLRLGIGAGLDPEFGAPQWRILAGIEMFGQAPRAPDAAAPAPASGPWLH
jgi:hypothetical protein